VKTLTLGSLFDGIGGFPLAAQRAGIKTIWASEIDPNCIEITKRHFPRMEHLGDITKLNGGKIPPADIISFGSPCQDLSAAGGQKGLDGERSVLFRDAVRIIYEMREATNGKYPTFVIWENVTGAFGSNGGRDFRAVLEEITNARIPMPDSGRWANAGMVGGWSGGASIAWRQLDSQYWGVPQRRKRIFLVGDFRADRAPEILFKREGLLGYVKKSRTKREKIAASLVHGVEIAGGADGGKCVVDFGRTADRVYINADRARAITASTGGWGSATGLYLMAECYAPGGHGRYAEGVGTLRASAGKHGYASGNLLVEMYAKNDPGGFREGCGPLRASGGDCGGGSENLIVVFQKMAFGVRCALRKLTPLECERLQGFPDNWTKYAATGGKIADTPRYAALGNSLAVPCAERVFRGIVAVTGGFYEHNSLR
jgi:DNA (cytosine-5)-methyltransferase 1